MTIPSAPVIGVCIGSANRTKSAGSVLEEFDISRKHLPHISFAAGEHTCLGLHLARMETRVAVECLLTGRAHVACGPTPTRTETTVAARCRCRPACPSRSRLTEPTTTTAHATGSPSPGTATVRIRPGGRSRSQPTGAQTVQEDRTPDQGDGGRAASSRLHSSRSVPRRARSSPETGAPTSSRWNTRCVATPSAASSTWAASSSTRSGIR